MSKAFLELTKFYYKYLVRNKYFGILLLVAVLFLLFKFSPFFQTYRISFKPLTFVVLDSLRGNFSLFLLLIIIFFSGELYWKEREEHTYAFYDSQPFATWQICLAKQFALFLAIGLILFCLMGLSIVYQFFNGIININWSLYFIALWGIDWHYYFLVIILAFMIQAMVNNKYLGFVVITAFIFVNHILLPWLGIEHHLLLYAKAPNLIYTDLNGYGSYLRPIIFFRLYWTFVALLFGLMAYLFWLREEEQDWRSRLKIGKERFRKIRKIYLIFLMIGLITTGAYIFYNTNILNEYRPLTIRQKQAASYEKKYKQYEGLAQPTIKAVRLEVDLLPEVKKMLVEGSYQLINQNSEAIKRIHLLLPITSVIYHIPLELEEKTTLNEVNLSTPFSITVWDSIHNYFILELEEPMAKTDSLELKFNFSISHQGFKNQFNPHLDIIENGTLFYSMYWPRLGYTNMAELKSNGIRHKLDLSTASSMPLPNDPCCQTKQNPSVTLSIKTPKDYQAIASGFLQKEQLDSGFITRHYQCEELPSFLVGKYAVKRHKWQDKEIALYYHPKHDFHIDRMMQAAKYTLDYCRANFGDYPFRDLKIVEYPRYANHAVAFPSLIAYPEMSFIEASDERQQLDRISSVIAHEVAHQWWGVKLYGGNVQGQSVLSESMAQYISMMVMRKHFGEGQVKEFRRKEKHQYLIGRSHEDKIEKPLLFVEGQNYIHYRKGSVVMYGLQAYIGEDQLNRGLKAYYQDIISKENLKGNTLDWYQSLIHYTPDSLHYLLEEGLKKITLYDLSISKAHWSLEEQILTLDVNAQKYFVDESGKEHSQTMQDWVEITSYPEEKTNFYLIKRGVNQIQIPLSEKPTAAEIDPRRLLIEKNVSDNKMKVFTNTDSSPK